MTTSIKEQLDTLKKQCSVLEERHQSAKNRLIAMYKEKLDGILSDEDYALFRESLTAEELSISEQINQITQQIKDCQKRLESAESQKALLQKYTHFEHLDRSIADEFIEMVKIGMLNEDGEREIHIYWKL